VHVLRGLDLDVRAGEFLAIRGPSGCGKSTLLHVLGLMTPADGGELSILGEPAPRRESARAACRAQRIGFVFQRFNLIPTLSARANVEISLRVRGMDPRGRIDPLLEAMGVAHVARRKPGQMSIGEQQRVAVARALAHRPAILLADEPTGSLDSDNAAALLTLLADANARDGQTIVMITHSPDAARAATRRAGMLDGQMVQE
jgi:putative ABC transport system ATP-binding protein